MNILWNPNEAVDFIEMPLPLITEGTQDMGDGVWWLRAGTPLDEYFAVANDEDAKYVVAEDFYFISSKPDQAKAVPLITAGYVDINKAEQAAGITYSQDCIDALADEGIVLVDGTLPSSGGGGGGGGGVLVVHVIRTFTDGSETYTLDKTWQELADALNSGKTLSLVYWDPNENIGNSYFWTIFYLGVGLYKSDWQLNLETDSPDGYPTATIEF
ncbi:MAG: hypothetical protein IJG86_05110 [Clostridia bacterium]|nr:hypothetical protein [Clostridia bacterium]